MRQVASRHLWLGVLFFSHFMTSCTSGGISKRANSAQPVIDSSGAKIYSIDPKTGATLSASGVATDDHNFSQAAVIIPSGTLSFPVSVSMYQAETLITSDTQSAVGVGDLTATGPAVAVVPSQSVAVSGSLAISIPYNQPQSLTGSWKLVVIAVYQVDGKTVIETFPESQLDFKSTPGVVKLNVKYFGAFQVAYSQVEIPKIEKVEAPVVVVQKQITKPVTSSTPKPAQSPKVARPRVDVPPGSYKEVQVISLWSSTEGATIYYTTNGQIPTADSTKYSDPIKIENSKTMIIRAIALKNGFDPSDLFFGRYEVILPKAAISIEITDSDQNAVPREYTKALLAKGELSVGDCYNINLEIENSVNGLLKGRFAESSVDAMLQHGLLYDGADCKLENRYTDQGAVLTADVGFAIDQSRTFSFKPLKFIHGDGLVLEARIVSNITVVVPTAQKKLKIPEYPLNYELISLSANAVNGVSPLQHAFDKAYAKYQQDNEKTYIILLGELLSGVPNIDVTKTGWPKNIRLYGDPSYGDQAAYPNANSIENIFSNGKSCVSSSGGLENIPNKHDGKDIFIVGNGHVKVVSILANAGVCDHESTGEYVSYNAGHISLFNMKVESQVTAVGRNGGHGGNVFLSSVMAYEVDTSSYGLNVTPTSGGNAGNVTTVDGGANIIEAFGGAGRSKGGDGGVINIINYIAYPQSIVVVVGGGGLIVGKGGSCKINGNSCDGWSTKTIGDKIVMVRGNLMWSGLVRTQNEMTNFNFSEAKSECGNLSPKDGWRLPGLGDLLYARQHGITHYAKAGWINDMNKFFWYDSYPNNHAEIFNLNTGISSINSSDSSEKFPAICVRDHVWTRTQSGTTTIIKDEKTSLSWYESNGKLTLNDAKDSCTRGLIYQSWRLPTLHELHKAHENGIIFELTKDPTLNYVFWSEGLISGSYSNVDVANWAVDSFPDLNITRRTLCVQSSSEVQ